MPPSIVNLADLAYQAILCGLSQGHPALDAFAVDEQFFQELLHTASKRRLLTNSFLEALCASGTPPPSLSLEQREIDVRSILKPPHHHHSQHNPASTFSSSSEMLYTCITSFSLFNFGGSTYNNDDISSVLSHVSRLSSSLEEITLHKLSQTISSGSLKNLLIHCPLSTFNCTSLSVSDGTFLESLSSTSLTSLNLSKLSVVNDSDFNCLLTSPPPSLTSLNFASTNVANLTFTALATQPLLLSSLNLSSTSLSFPPLTRILDNLSQTLSTIDIRSTPLIDRGSELFPLLTDASLLPGLTSLSLTLYFFSEELLSPDDLVLTEEDLDYEIYAFFSDPTVDDVPAPDPTPQFELPADLWMCPHCTLINEIYNDRCEACNGKRRDLNALSPSDLTLTTPPPNRPLFKMAAISQNLKTLNLNLFVDDEKSRLVHASYFVNKNPDAAPPILSSPYARDRGKSSDASSSNSPPPVSTPISTKAATSFFSSLASCLPSTLLKFSFSVGSYSPDANEDLPATPQSAYTPSFSLTETTASNLSSSSPSITNLQLNSLRLPSIGPFFTLISTLPNLTNLCVTSQTKVGNSTTTSDLITAISSSANALTDLQLIVHNPSQPTPTALITTAFLNSAKNDPSKTEVVLSSSSLLRLWIDGFSHTERLTMETPSLERLHISDCNSLLFFSFNNPAVCENLRDMRISNNSSLLPQTMSSLNAPNMKRLEIDKITGLNDIQLGELTSRAINTLVTMRLKSCRNLSDCRCWLSNTGFRPLCVLELEKPSPSFDLPTLCYLLDTSSNMRELRITHASGLGDIICAITAPSPSEKNLLGATMSPNPNASFLSTPSPEYASSHTNSALGAGAMDEEMGEHLGLRGIQRILHDFMNNASAGQEYGFPPTLSAYQRKMVHQVAERLDLDHESIKLKSSGSKVVKVKKKRRVPIVNGLEQQQNPSTLSNTPASPPPAASNPPVGSLSSALEQHIQEQQQQQQQIQQVYDHHREQYMNEYASASNMGSMWASESPPVPNGLLERDRRDSTVNFKIDDIEEFSDDGGGKIGAGDQDEDEDLFQLDEETVQSSPETPPAPPTSRRQSRKAEREYRRRMKAGSYDGGETNDPKNALTPPPKTTKYSKKEKGGDDMDDGFLDKVLQCEVPPHVNNKFIKRMTAIAHQLPRDVKSSKPICISNLRGMCNNKAQGCKYAHFEMKKDKDIKKFGALVDFVCSNIGASGIGRDKDGGDRTSPNIMSPSTPHSYGSAAEAGSYMERYLGGSGKKKSKKEKQREHWEGDWNGGMDRSGTSPKSESGTSPGSLGTSPKTLDWGGMGGGVENRGGEIMPPPLSCANLLSLSLNDCENVMIMSFSAPSLARLVVKRCPKLATLNLHAPVLNTLDASGSEMLATIPLHEKSLRGLRVAKLTGCKLLNETFVHKLVNHCQALRQLHIYGSGAAAVAANAKGRTKVKTKKGLERLKRENSKLEVITTKDQMKRSNKKDLEMVQEEMTRFELTSP